MVGTAAPREAALGSDRGKEQAMAEPGLKSEIVSETGLPNHHCALSLLPKQEINNKLSSYPSSSP